jgi:hypothetical protein
MTDAEQFSDGCLHANLRVQFLKSSSVPSLHADAVTDNRAMPTHSIRQAETLHVHAPLLDFSAALKFAISVRDIETNSTIRA